MDGGAWWAAVHGVSEGRIRLSIFTFTFHFHALEEEMATHSSVLAWRIPWTEEPGGLPSMGSHRVGHDLSDLAAAADTPSELLALYHSLQTEFVSNPQRLSRAPNHTSHCQIWQTTKGHMTFKKIYTLLSKKRQRGKGEIFILEET